MLIEILHSFTNREIAGIIWVALLAIWALSVSGVRDAFFSAIKTLLHWKILVPFLLISSAVGGEVWCLAKLSFVGVSDTKDIAFWYLGTFLGLFISSNKVAENPSHYRQVILDVLKISVLIEFLLSQYTFSLIGELILTLLLTVFSILSYAAGMKQEHKAAKRVSDFVLFVLFLIVFGRTLGGLMSSGASLLTWVTIKEVLLSPILTVISTPLLIVLSYFIILESRFVLIKSFHLSESPYLARVACFYVAKSCFLSFTRLDRLRGGFYLKLSECRNRGNVEFIVDSWASGRGQILWNQAIEDEYSRDSEMS